MKRAWIPWSAACLAALSPGGAGAFTGDVGDIAVIEDTTGAIHATIMIPPSFCQETAKVFYLSHPDDFDSIVAFTTKNLDFLSNVYQGTPVRNDVEGIGMILIVGALAILAAHGLAAGRRRPSPAEEEPVVRPVTD